MALVSIPATVFAEDKDPTPWQYKDHFIKMEALIDEDAEASYDRFMKFVKIEDRYHSQTVRNSSSTRATIRIVVYMQALTVRLLGSR